MVKKFYFVWHPLTNEILLEADKVKPLNVLVSFYFAKGKNRRIPLEFRNKVFLDSGAFSAFKTKTEIDLYDYIDWIKDNRANAGLYSNMDVIGNAETSEANQLGMEKEGLTPIPCFHANEPFSYLEKYCKKYDYISLGGIAQLSTHHDYLVQWLKKCFSIIPKDIKVHGFAVSKPLLVRSFPFYSVDSSSWSSPVRFGSIIQFQHGKRTTRRTERITNNKESNDNLLRFAIEQWRKMEDEYYEL